MELDKILKKPGRDWAPEEAKAVSMAIKKQGRAALKAKREALRNGS